MDPVQKQCPRCSFAVLDTFYFCPNCGKNVKPVPPSTSLVSQIGVYFVSIFLPPLGLWPAIKYLGQNNGTAKVIGIVALILTLTSVCVSAWLLMGLLDQTNQMINSQLKIYQNLGL